jgi:hypothetical protein
LPAHKNKNRIAVFVFAPMKKSLYNEIILIFTLFQ